MLSNELQIYIKSPKQPSISTILTKKTIPAQRFHRISEPGFHSPCHPIFHSRQFTSSFTEKFKPIFTTFLPLILKASA